MLTRVVRKQALLCGVIDQELFLLRGFFLSRSLSFYVNQRFGQWCHRHLPADRQGDLFPLAPRQHAGRALLVELFHIQRAPVILGRLHVGLADEMVGIGQR